ncbi:MAG: M48 family metallopeptidase [Nitrospira sp.]|nr:M48 family metallopeptidase [Nitrospira sp.]MBH0185098.1 M48 family metallopeptidase [Nitrospira sp.]
MNRWRDKDEFKRRVLDWAVKLEVEVRSLSVRTMRNKWASCSLRGNLNFNVELLALDREVGDYVIVHELLHFFVPNHGKLWKSLMRVHLGDHEQVSARLPAEGLAVSPKRREDRRSTPHSLPRLPRA